MKIVIYAQFGHNIKSYFIDKRELLVSQSDQLYVWIDCEMTGLDIFSDRLLEVCVLITDKNFEVIAQSSEYVIYQPQAILDQMDDWNQKQHRASGLYSLVQQSSYSVQEVDMLLTRWLQSYVHPKTAPLCGNSIHQDRFFLKRYLPSFEALLHYRHIDVSTLKELFRHKLSQPYEKNASAHRALSDIYESLEELKFYLKNASLLAQ